MGHWGLEKQQCKKKYLLGSLGTGKTTVSEKKITWVIGDWKNNRVRKNIYLGHWGLQKQQSNENIYLFFWDCKNNRIRKYLLGSFGTGKTTK